MRKLHKRLTVIWLAGTLALSNVVTALAADVSPGYYVFAMALRACGVSPGEKVGAWQNAYEGYLEKTGNQALLSQVKGYGSLSWGSTAQGVDDLYWSVRQWLSSATVKESGDNSCLYELPSSPAPQPDKLTVMGTKCIRSVPFPDINPLPSTVAGGYTYLFSDIFINNQGPPNNKVYYFKRNVYVPNGLEIIGIVTDYNSFHDWICVKYYTPDTSSPSGYREINVKSIGIAYFVENDSLWFKETAPSDWNFNKTDPRSVMNYPFKIFSTAKDAENYCKTGAVSNLFTTDSITLLSGGINHGSDLELIKRKVVSVDSQMTLPADATAAGVSLGAVSAPLDWKSLSASLGAGGLQIEYDSALETEPPESMVVGAVSSFTDTILQTLLSLLPWGLLVFAVVVLVFLFVKIYKRMTNNA